MAPEHLRFGGGAADSAIHPLVAVYLLIAILLILFLPRNKAIVPFLVAFFTIPIGQVLVLGGFHFTALRVLILAGLARRVSFRKTSGGKFPGGVNALDWTTVLWSVSAVIAFWLEFMERSAFINGFGVLLDTLGGFLVVRSLIPDGDTMRRTIKTLAVICAILGACMINEQISHVNVFGLLGGTSSQVVVRDGHQRAGATLGCLYAGAFAGVLIPVFLWLWKEANSRAAALAGLAGATAMVVTSYSSTSWIAFTGSLVGLAFWPLRQRMRIIRWGIMLSLISLHMVMKAPVWALIARIDLTGSSSSEQRYMLVDMTIRHFSDWWLLGTSEYVNWGWDSWDLCNQFVAVALTGGLLALIFYVGIFVRGFSAIGRARKLVEGDTRQEWLFWCLGSSLFATVVAHFGINYMAQLIMGFFPLVVCISVATSQAMQRPAQGADLSTETPEESVTSSWGYRVPAGELRMKATAGLSPEARGRERFGSQLKTRYSNRFLPGTTFKENK
ncbi:MAG TPA: hypothetical protein VMW38_22420 [Terriglobia bacterium]|nr:hypothetical protein [Terriglobia bacterium]